MEEGYYLYKQHGIRNSVTPPPPPLPPSPPSQNIYAATCCLWFVDVIIHKNTILFGEGAKKSHEGFDLTGSRGQCGINLLEKNQLAKTTQRSSVFCLDSVIL